MGKELKKEIATIVSRLAGYPVTEENVHSDEAGWYYYIPAKSLQEGRPLLLIHYRVSAFIVIPYRDYQSLERGLITPQEYIETSKWGYGYYWGGGSLVGGCFWQPLEEGIGIYDTAKISRYLHMLSCRTNRRSSGAIPTPEQCKNCSVKGCPVQRGSFKSEIPEIDYRVHLFKALAERADQELGIKLRGLCCSDLPDDEVILTPGKPGECSVTIPQTLSVDLLNNPGERDWKELCKKFRFDLSTYGMTQPKAVENRQQVEEVLQETGILLQWRTEELKNKVINLESSLYVKKDEVRSLEKELKNSIKELAELEGEEKIVVEKPSFFQTLKGRLGLQ